MARRTRTLLATAATGLALAGALVAAPAASAVSDTGTTATIVLTAAGTLGISAPAGDTTTPVALGSTASKVGSYTTGGLGEVKVTDGRTGILNNNWAATATVTDFAYVGTAPTGATLAQTVIPASTMVYNVNAGTQATTGAVFTAAGGAIAANTVAVGAMVSLVPQTQTWNPTLTVILTNQVAGTYRGTITHSAL